MIFKPELVEKILAAEKTETRRPVKPGQAKCRYKPWGSYALQPGRGKKAVGRIRMVEIRRERLGDINEEGATREGFENRAAFLAYWKELYGRVDESQEVWAMRFKLPPPPRTEPEEGEGDVVDFDAEKHKRRRGHAFLLQGNQYREIRSANTDERVSMTTTILRALKLYSYIHELKRKGGQVELIDAKGARWILNGWRENKESGDA